MISDGEEIRSIDGFDNHRLITTLWNKDHEVRGYIAIHRGGYNMPVFGATRIWSYRSDEEALQDVLRLSRTMSYKSALAGYKFGGAKAVLFAPIHSRNRLHLFSQYGQFVNLFGGRFITGADVGVTKEDLVKGSRVSQSIIGLKVDPIYYTVQGLLESVSVVLLEITGRRSFSGRSFAIQGLGKTGVELIKTLYAEAKTLYVTDINPTRCKDVIRRFPRVRVVAPNKIYHQVVDIFCPCALGGILNEHTVDVLRAKAVVGIANSQLANDRIGDVLYKKSILYAPDYVVNAGGFHAIVEEYRSKNPKEKSIVSGIEKIGKTIHSILQTSKKKSISPHRVSDEIGRQRIELCK